MEDPIVLGRVDEANQDSSIFNSKTFKKYKLASAVIVIGVFFVPVAVLGGVLAGLGTKMGMDRLKESNPQIYNWVLDNPGWVELATMAAYAGAFGLTLGGVLISLVANFTMSMVLDHYAEKEGKVQGVEALSLSGFIKSIIQKFKSLFRTAKESVRQSTAQAVPA